MTVPDRNLPGKTPDPAALAVAVRGVAHDLNNALTTLMACLHELGTATPNTPDWQVSLDVGNQTVKYGARLVQLLAQYAGSLTGRPGTHDCDVPELLVDAVGLAFAGSVVRADLHSDPDLPRIHGDSTQLMQVFMNLLVNARQAMTQPGIVAIRCTRATAPSAARLETVRLPWIVVSITDQGPGIKPEHRDKLFTAYFSTKEGGTGLGLNVARSIVEAHGGTLTLQPGQSGGTTATVLLPCGKTTEPRRPTDTSNTDNSPFGNALVTTINEEDAVNKQKALSMARKLGIDQAGKMDTTELIRSIQTREGNTPCFMAGETDCKESACLWRGDCQTAR
jgi:nitrogen-specific signal transduction histidine kinase